MLTGNWKRVTDIDGRYHDVNFDNVCEMHRIEKIAGSVEHTNIVLVTGFSLKVKETVEQIRLADELGVLSR